MGKPFPTSLGNVTHCVPGIAEEARNVSKPLASSLGKVTHTVLAEVVGQLKQVGKIKEDVEGLKQAQAHTAQGLTYLATVGPPSPVL